MHRLNCSSLWVAGLVACAVAVTGCSPGGMDTDYVEGVVTIDGTPVPEATVTFVPVTEGQGVSATGITDESGIYKLTAVGAAAENAVAEAGTVPGEYYVGVEKTTIESPLTEEEAEEQGVEYVPPRGGDTEVDKITYVVPQKYNNPRDSGITVTVKEGKNDIPIQLTR